jgi:hypothetical protein
MEDSDPFDLATLRVDSERVRQPARPKKWQRHYVNVPWQWVERLRRAKRISTYRLALVLLYEHWRTGGRPIVLSNVFALAGTTMSSMENFAWFRFDARHSAGPIFHVRDSAPVSPRVSLCVQCGKPYRPQRSDSKVCSDACRQRVYRERLSVTQV